MNKEKGMILEGKVCHTRPCWTLFTSAAIGADRYLPINYMAKFHKTARISVLEEARGKILTANSKRG